MTDVGGRTTKETYVTTYTTRVDPRTLPDFASRGVVDGTGRQHDDDARRRHHRHHPEDAAAGSQRHPRGPAPLPMPPQQQQQQRHTRSPSYSPSQESSIADSVDGHRLRKKYTTTTVTTITTTTVLLPKMQEALVFPSMTTHQMDQHAHARPAIADHRGGYDGVEGQTQLSRQPQRVYQIESGHTSPASASPDRQRQLQSSSANGRRLVPSQPQYDANGDASQAWVFQQQTANDVRTEENYGRLPTLAELGITSYFAKDDGVEGGPHSQQQQQRRAAPYAPANPRVKGQSSQQPWVTAETRHEVEGGRRYY